MTYKRRPGDEPIYPLITHDPVSGGELLVTRLECPESDVVIEGRFSLGWIGLLSPDQLDFVGLLVRHRGNVQRLAAELGVAYNTARNRLDDIVAALGVAESADPEDSIGSRRAAIMDRLAAGEIAYDEALRLLKGL